jgi:phosphate:Na+ symporter
MELLAQIAAGLGLFFIGVDALSATQRETASPWFQNRFKRASDNSILSSGLGFLLGAITQSSSAVTFIVMNLVTAGYSRLKSVVPLILWANVGTSVLVFIASLHIEYALYFLLGFVGICYYFKWNNLAPIRVSLAVLFGVCMLMLGVFFIKQGAAGLKDIDWLTGFLLFASKSLLLAFLIGVVLCLILQSSATVTVIVATLASVEVLTWYQALMIIIGASLGSGFNVWLLSANLRGLPQRITYLQLISKMVGVALLCAVFWAEYYGGLQLLKAPLATLTGNIALQFAIAYLAMQLLSVLPVLLFKVPILRVTKRLSPQTLEESLSKPKYIYSQAVEDPATAVALVTKEQARQIQRLLAFVYRGNIKTEGRKDLLRSHFDASMRVTNACEAFLLDLENRASGETAHIVLGLKRCNQMYSQMLVDLREYSEQVLALSEACHGDESVLNIVWVMEEELCKTVSLLADIAGELDAAVQRRLLAELSGLHSGDQFASYITKAHTLDVAHAASLRTISVLLGRVTWSAQWYGEQMTGH